MSVRDEAMTEIIKKKVKINEKSPPLSLEVYCFKPLLIKASPVLVTFV